MLIGLLVFAIAGGVGQACGVCDGPLQIVEPWIGTHGSSQAIDADGVVHLVTTEIQLPPDDCSESHYFQSPDEGLSWTGPRIVGSDPVFVPCSVNGTPYGVASDGEAHVYVPFVAREGLGGPLALVVAVSDDRGLSWPSVVHRIAGLSADPGYRSYLLIGGTAGRAWAFWTDGPTEAEYHLYAGYTTDAGRTWSVPRQVDAGVMERAGGFLVERTEAGRIHVFLDSGPDSDTIRLRVATSLDDGRTWLAPVVVDALGGPARLGITAILPLAGDEVMVAWWDRSKGWGDLWSRWSPDAGLSWPEPPVRIDAGDLPGESDSGGAHVVRTGPAGELAAVWIDRRSGAFDVFANFSRDGGRTWGEPAGSPAFQISAPVADGFPSPLRAAGSAIGWVHAAWGDSIRDGDAICGRIPCPKVYATVSCDGGRTWEAERIVISPADKPSLANVRSYRAGAAGLFGSGDNNGSTATHLRLDGPTTASPKGPTTYCMGRDPELEALAVSGGCTGGLALQWYVDGAAVPGATGLTFRPALAAGDHRVEVRGTCPTDPACTHGFVPLELHARAPSVPPEVGNRLWAVRRADEVELDWSRAPASADVHAHVRRSATRGVPGPLVAPDPHPGRTFRDRPAASPSGLWLYDVRQADVCEAESGN